MLRCDIHQVGHMKLFTRLLVALLLTSTLTGCTSLLIPEKPRPSDEQLSRASMNCLVSFHPQTPQFGSCVNQQITPMLEAREQRENIKTIVGSAETVAIILVTQWYVNRLSLQAALASYQ